MKGLFQLLQRRDLTVHGCDQNDRKVDKLNARNLHTHHGHDVSHLNGSTTVDVVIHSAAVPEDHPELVSARKQGIPIMSYAEGLATLFNQKEGIAVCGTHGKTTCTALLSRILEEAGMDPTSVVGGNVLAWNRNARSGDGDYFVAEACEFSGNFLSMQPDHVLLTNVDQDHMEYFVHERKLLEQFGTFLSHQNPEGLLVWNRSNLRSQTIVEQYSSAQTHGVSSKTIRDYPKPMPGPHQQWNAGMVGELCKKLGIPEQTIHAVLHHFKGVSRRCEVKDRRSGHVFIDDYAHHPTEIRHTLTGISQQYPDRNLLVCFQPHQFSRTKYFLDEWGNAFEHTDEIWLLPIFSARDSEDVREEVSLDQVRNQLQTQNLDVRTLPGLSEAAEELQKAENNRDQWVYVTMGAGDVWKIFDYFENEAVKG